MITFDLDQNQCMGWFCISRFQSVNSVNPDWIFHSCTAERRMKQRSRVAQILLVIIRQHFGLHLSVWQGHVIWPALVCLRHPPPFFLCVTFCAVAVECCCFMCISPTLPSGTDSRAAWHTIPQILSLKCSLGWSTQERVKPGHSVLWPRLGHFERFTRREQVAWGLDLRCMIYFYEDMTYIASASAACVLSVEFKNPVCSVACV